MKRRTLVGLALLVFGLGGIGGMSVEAADLRVTVLDAAGQPAEGVAIQVFSGELTPEEDREPIPPPQKRADGLIGFMTDVQGRVSLALPTGDYTIVAFSPRREHRFCLVRHVQVPGEVILNARQATPVTVTALDVEGQPLVGAGIYFRPSRRTRGLVGFVGNDGVLKLHVSPGRYHVVLTSSSLYYLLHPDITVGTEPYSLRFDARTMPIARLVFELPEDPAVSFGVYPNTFPALYEVLETDLTYEYVDMLEKQIGYDAAYTDIWSLLAFGARPEDYPVIVSAGHTYHLNLSYVVVAERNAPVYAYELRPRPQYFAAGTTYRLGNPGDYPFTLQVALDRSGDPPRYHPGETAQVRYRIEDTRGQQMYRLFSFSDARLIFPLVTVTDPDGRVIATNPETTNFFEYTFALPSTARAGDYQVHVFLDAQLYGKLAQTLTFRVVPPRDTTPPQVIVLESPNAIEAGQPLRVRGRVTDDGALRSVELVLDGTPHAPETIQGAEYDWRLEDLPLGDHTWEIRATDSAENQTRQRGSFRVLDTRPPEVAWTLPDHLEWGLATQITLSIQDASPIRQAQFWYQLPDGSSIQGHSERVGARWTLDLPPFEQEGTVRIRGEVADASGNRTWLPGPDAQTWSLIPIRDTLPPVIQQLQAAPVLPGEPIPVEVSVTDHHGVAEVRLVYARPGGQPQTIPMQLQGTRATATLPPTMDTWMYFVEATDLPDATGATRTTRSERYQTAPIQVGSVRIMPQGGEADPIRVPAGSQRAFKAEILDAEGRPLPVPVAWMTTGGIGRIDARGVFTASARIGNKRIGTVVALPLWGQRGEQRSAQVWVEVVAGDLAQIHITPSTATIPAGEVHDFLVRTTDRFGNPVDVPIQGEAPPGSVIEFLDRRADGSVPLRLRAGKVGAGDLLLRAGDYRLSIPVRVVPGRPVALELARADGGRITPPLQVQAGQPVAFTAILIDAGGNRYPVHPSWYVRGGVGNIDAQGRFMPERVGQGQILAVWDGLMTAVEVEIAPGPLERITVEPFIDYLPLSTKLWARTRQFVAFGWDRMGNPVPIRNLRWATDAAAGSIDANGLFTATSEIGDAVIGNVVINGTVYARGEAADGHERTGTGVVVIQHQPPGPIERLRIVLQNFGMELDHLSLKVGEKRKFEVTGLDARNRRWAVQPIWEVEGEIGTITPTGEFTAMRPGQGAVVASWEGHTARVNLTVTPGLLHTLRLRPPSATLRVGETLPLHVEGYDQFGNFVQAGESFWQVDSPAILRLEGDPPLLRALQPGIAHVEARVGDIVAYASVRVLAGEPMVLRWRRVVDQLRAGETFAWEVEAFDAGGNRVNASPTWQVEGEIGTIDPTGLFLAERAGEGRIVATVGRHRLTAPLRVLPAAPVRLRIVPSHLTLVPGMRQRFEAWGEDAFGNRVPLEGIRWSLLGPGTLKSGETPGQVEVSASDQEGILTLAALADGLEARAYLFVVRAESLVPESIHLWPAETVALPVGQTQALHVWLRTRNGAFLPVLGEWQGDETGVAISPWGRVRPLVPGEHVLSVRYGNLQAAIRILAEAPATPPAWPSGGDADSQTGGILELPWERLSAQVGERVPLLAFLRYAPGERHRVDAGWEVVSGSVLLSEQGFAIALRPGRAQLAALWQGQRVPLEIEVDPGEARFMRLMPPTASVTRLRPGPVRFAPVFYDGWGNEIPGGVPEPLTWLAAGGVGTVSSEGSFLGFTDVPQNRQGEVLALLPERNLIARSRIYLYGLQKEAVELRLEPGELTVIPGEKVAFHAIPLDAEGRVLSEPVQWQVQTTGGHSLPGLITAEGVLQIPTGQFLGETLRVLASLDGLQAESLVKVQAGPPVALQIHPSGEVEARPGEVIDFQATARDRAGNPVNVPPRWFLEGEVGTLDAQTSPTVRFRATAPGEGRIRAAVEGMSASVLIRVLSEAMETLLLWPAGEDGPPAPEAPGQRADRPWRLHAGESLALVLGDARGISLRQEGTWRLVAEAPLGELSGTGVFQAAHVGTGRIEAQVDSRTATFYVEVLPGPLARVEVRPGAISVLTHATQRFEAVGWDAYGNPVAITPAWSVVGGIGSIDAEGVFTPYAIPAGQSWQGLVVATAGALSGSARVSITGELGALSRLGLEFDPTPLAAGEVGTLRVRGWDDQGNLLPEIQAIVQREPSLGELEPLAPDRWHYRAPQTLPTPPEVHFRATAGDLEASLTLPLVPGPPAQIQLPAIQVAVGETISVDFQVLDAFGNPIPEARPTWSAATGDLQVADHTLTYRSTVAGTHELVARLGGMEQRFSVRVLPSALSTVVIHPENLRLTAGETATITITLRDPYGNELDPEAWSPVLRAEPATLGALKRIAPARWEITASRAGTGYLRVQVGDRSYRAPLTVDPGSLATLRIGLRDAPNERPPYRLISGATVRFEAIGEDALGNQVDAPIRWALRGEVGRLTEQGAEAILEAWYVGEARLRATAGGIVQEVALVVQPYQAEVGPEGGKLVSPGGLALRFPPGALERQTRISVERVRPPVAEGGTTRQSRGQESIFAFQIQGEATRLRRPVELRMPWPESQGEASWYQIHFWDPFQQGWIPSGLPVPKEKGSLRTQVNHLGIFAVLPVSAPSEHPSELHIERLRAQPAVFYAPEINALTLSYRLVTGDAPQAEVSVMLYNLRNQRVATLLDREMQWAGDQTLQWDGRDDRGRLVPNGRYVLMVVARASGRTAIARTIVVVFK